MPTDHRATLARIKRFDQLIAYLRDEMGWPIRQDSFEEVDDLFFALEGVLGDQQPDGAARRGNGVHVEFHGGCLLPPATAPCAVTRRRYVSLRTD